MAELVLAGVGAAVGGAVGGVTGAAIGQAIGAAIGSQIDNRLFSSTTKLEQEGPRLQEVQILTSSEGYAIVRGYGRFRISGNIIWATRFREQVVRDSTTQGGKGRGGGGGTTTTTTTYNYFANFAVALCEGEIQGIDRVWADNKLIDLSKVTHRIYRGTQTQQPDSLITSKEGAGNVPGYRGIAYIVFENLQVNRFGNRIPQLSFEITKPVNRSDNQGVSDLLKGVDVIPGDTEFGYDPGVVEQVIFGPRRGGGFGGGLFDRRDIIERRVENNHDRSKRSNWSLAMDQLSANLPNCETVTLVVGWFGTDLRVNECEIRPKVENNTKSTEPYEWRVAGLTRTGGSGRIAALVVSSFEDNPAFAGSPNDLSVYKAIRDLKARGYKVTFLPHIFMDIPHGNTLPNPYSANGTSVGQPAYPWRGLITCNPSIGQTGTVDKTAAARTQVSSFLGNVSSSHFSGSAGRVNISSSVRNDWGYRRFILHYAELCRQAGGVNHFCIGSGMAQSTRIRDQNNAFPFVDGLKSLAAEVTNLIPSSLVGYAADWSEYHSYQPTDGSNDVYFNMDPLWSDSNIDFIGINNYLPISDWRDGGNHADYGTGNDEFGNPRGESIYDLDYLKGQVGGGEYSDYFYTSEADRQSQTRTAITDGAHNEPWVFANKRIKDWWQNSHRDRPGGVRNAGTTSWVAQSKPIIFTEFGSPAINKGTNTPGAFFDPKSSGSSVPYFSSGSRDDEIQRQYIRAMVEYWGDSDNNPSSNRYVGRMIDTSSNSYWSYDARPWPTFPTDGDTWADQSNWEFGHWISGRIDTVYMPDLLRELAEDYEISAPSDFSRAYGTCDGFLVQSKTSFRSTVEPLTTLFMFDIIESGGQFKAVSEQEVRSLVTLDLDDIVEAPSEQVEPVMITRKQETELPASVTIRYIDIFSNYEPASVYQTREVVEASGAPVTDSPIVLDINRAQQMVDRLLYSNWAKRTAAEFGLLPEFIYLESGDVVTINDQGLDRPFRLETVSDGSSRKIVARSFGEALFETGVSQGRSNPINLQPVASSVLLSIMDLPILTSTDTPHQPYVASFINPWPEVNIFKSITTSNFSLDTTVLQPSIIGETTAVFNPGVTDVWDYANSLEVVLYSDELSTATEEAVLNNANTLAIENELGEWEVIQFVNAQLTDTRTYTLTKLLRGQLGTEDNMQENLPVGARVVVLDNTIQQVQLGIDDIDREYNYRYGPADTDIGDNVYVTIQQTVQGRGLKPLSPVHIRSVKNSVGDRISWTRRTRISGDNWEYIDDVPLGEAFERYQIEVMAIGSSTVVRTITVIDSTQVTYPTFLRQGDGLPEEFDVIIYQLSDIVGRGTGRRATVGG